MRKFSTLKNTAILGLVVVLSSELARLFCKDSTKQMAGGPSPCTQRSNGGPYSNLLKKLV